MNIQISQGIGNTSLQIGDELYYVSGTPISNQGSVTSSPDTPTLIGTVTGINVSTNTVTVDSPLNTPSADDFVMFSKNKLVNNTSLIGYFAEVKLKNSSTDRAELFALSSEVAESSK